MPHICRIPSHHDLRYHRFGFFYTLSKHLWKVMLTNRRVKSIGKPKMLHGFYSQYNCSQKRSGDQILPRISCIWYNVKKNKTLGTDRKSRNSLGFDYLLLLGLRSHRTCQFQYSWSSRDHGKIHMNKQWQPFRRTSMMHRLLQAKFFLFLKFLVGHNVWLTDTRNKRQTKNQHKVPSWQQIRCP